MDVISTTFETSDGRMPVLVARPEGSATGPTIVMIHENHGLTEYMRAVLTELAGLGFTVVAPDLMARVDQGAQQTTRAVPVPRHVSDVQACISHFAGEDGCTAIIVVGFCFGAEIAMLSALDQTEVLAVVAWYGIPPPPEASRCLHAPLLLLLAQDDDRVNQHVPPFLDALEEAGSDFVAMSFPGTKHAFHDRTRPDRYSERAAAAAWRIGGRYLRALRS